MQVPYGEDVASHSDPESCAVAREGGREALTGEGVGRVLSSETQDFRDADAVPAVGRQHHAHRNPRGVLDPAESKTPSTRRSLVHGNREISRSVAMDGTATRKGNPEGATRR